LPGNSLKKYFGVFLFILGFYEMIRRDKVRDVAKEVLHENKDKNNNERG